MSAHCGRTFGHYEQVSCSTACRSMHLLASSWAFLSMTWCDSVHNRATAIHLWLLTLFACWCTLEKEKKRQIGAGSGLRESFQLAVYSLVLWIRYHYTSVIAEWGQKQACKVLGVRTQLQGRDRLHPVCAMLFHLNESIVVGVGLPQKDISSQRTNQAEEMLAGSVIAIQKNFFTGDLVDVLMQNLRLCAERAQVYNSHWCYKSSLNINRHHSDVNDKSKCFTPTVHNYKGGYVLVSLNLSKCVSWNKNNPVFDNSADNVN